MDRSEIRLHSMLHQSGTNLWKIKILRSIYNFRNYKTGITTKNDKNAKGIQDKQLKIIRQNEKIIVACVYGKLLRDWTEQSNSSIIPEFNAILS